MKPISPIVATRSSPAAGDVRTLNRLLAGPWSASEIRNGRAVAASLIGDGVVEAFKREGWRVDFVPDSRDGNYYTFKPKQ